MTEGTAPCRTDDRHRGRDRSCRGGFATAFRTEATMRVRTIGRMTAGLAVAAVLAGPAAAQEMTFFTIGTGGTGGTYYPLGGVIANAISNPPGSRPCEEGGSCGVPGLVAVAQSSRGSVNNVNGISSGLFDSGFSQSDVAYWAYT